MSGLSLTLQDIKLFERYSNSPFFPGLGSDNAKDLTYVFKVTVGDGRDVTKCLDVGYMPRDLLTPSYHDTDIKYLT